MLQERRYPWKQGTAIDMSATGMLLELQSQVEPGNEIELVMDWNGLYHGKERMRLLLTVEVLRCEPRGIAVRIMEHQFEEVTPVVPARYVKGKARLAVA